MVDGLANTWVGHGISGVGRIFTTLKGINMTECALRKTLKSIVFDNPPQFHFWAGKPQTGGFSESYFNFMEDLLATELRRDNNEGVISLLETGAGLSTLFFLSLGYRVSSFSLPDVIEKVRDFLAGGQFSSLQSHWDPHGGRSELLLPSHVVKGASEYDCCLIDGSHSVHSVFVDFMYCHEVLGVGGLLFVDDTHFPGPSLLSQLLNQLDGYVECGSFNKVRTYKRVNGRKFYDNMTSMSFNYP